MPSSIFQWKLIGFRDIAGRFAKATDRLRFQSVQLANEAGDMLVEEMRKEAPVGVHYDISDDGTVKESRPGTLRNSITKKVKRTQQGAELDILAVDYAKYVINKTKGHYIKAKNVRFLRFYWAGAPPEVVAAFGSNVVYFRRVWNPGNQNPNPFHKRALDRLQPQLQQRVNKGISYVKEWLEGGG